MTPKYIKYDYSDNGAKYRRGETAMDGLLWVLWLLGVIKSRKYDWYDVWLLVRAREKNEDKS